MENKKGGAKNVLVIGLALFAMFFGSGNLIFPPTIGIEAGADWWIGFICYFIADAGFGILAVIAMLRADGNMDRITGLTGTASARLMNTAVILCIGPGLAIPRNGAVTFSLGITPLLGIDPNNRAALAIFSVIFFALVLVLTIRPSKVIDIVGAFLTPILVITLLILIIVGIVNPQASAGESITDTVIRDGIYNGYQTVDMLAGLFFAILVINSAHEKGYTDKASSTGIVVKSGLLSGFLLMIVYGGLSFLGSSTGMLYRDDFENGRIDQAGILINITKSLIGQPGMIILALIVTFACLTTAIGLTSAAGDYFTGLSNGKVSYQKVVIIICVVSALLCNMGLAQIISVAGPILNFLYPIIVFSVIAFFLTGKIRKKTPYLLGTVVTLIISLLTTGADVLHMQALDFIHTAMPLDFYGFNWLVPAVIAFVIGMFLPGGELKLPED